MRLFSILILFLCGCAQPRAVYHPFMPLKAATLLWNADFSPCSAALQDESDVVAHITVTFDRSGSVSNAVIDRGLADRAEVAACVVQNVRTIQIEPADEATTWGRTFRLRLRVEGESARPFDRGAAAIALGAVSIRTCPNVDGLRGPGHVRLRFAPDGVVVDAAVDAPPYAGTDVAACVEDRFMSARIPAYSGAPVPVGKSFTL